MKCPISAEGNSTNCTLCGNNYCGQFPTIYGAVFAVIPGIFLLLGIIVWVMRWHRRRSDRSASNCFTTEKRPSLPSVPLETFEEWSCRNASLHPGRVPTDPLCAICIDTIHRSELVSALSCLHFFHGECFRQMVVAGITKCPVCKQPVSNETEPQKDIELSYFMVV